MPTHEECFRCEKLTRTDRPHWMVHITVHGTQVAEDYDGEDSQGCFVVGNECRKHYPLAFKVEPFGSLS